MATAALDRALLDMDTTRKAFEAAAVRVSEELEQLQERVTEANAKLSGEREHTARAVGKRRRRSGGGAGAGAGEAHGGGGGGKVNGADAQIESRFNESVEDAEERLQTATRAMARVHAATQSVRASVDAAKADAVELLSAERLASAKESRNEGCNELIRLMGRVDFGGTNHEMILRHLGVASLWRVCGVSRSFRRWATSMLSSLPRVVAVGGVAIDRSATPPKYIALSSVESLDLSTMRWSAAGCMPSLPDPRFAHSVSCFADGRVVVCGGFNFGRADPMHHLASTALQWLPGTGAWSALPDLPAGRVGAASVRLPDGRTMLIGGFPQNTGQALASVLVLAADGSRWSDLSPLTGPRAFPAAALLPDGKVLVAGGQTTTSADTALKTAELWDPTTQKWTALPPMVHTRYCAVACILSSGQVAVVAGADANNVARRDGEVFDPAKREWKPLGAEMTHKHGNISAVAVAGGLIVVGGENTELYDEESGRWVTLPHGIADKRKGAGLVSVPVAPVVVAAAMP
jgi:N-acetylneuraminic acid mutarotase